MAKTRSDEELVREARAGSQQDFSELLARYKDAVFGVAFHRLQDFEEARDVTQEAFVKAFQGLGRLRRPAAFANWLCRIANGTALDRARRRKAEVSLEEAAHVAPNAAAPRAEDVDVAREVREALDTLPDASRLALILHYVNGYSHSEVAEFLGTTEGAVKTRVSRAKRRLREEMAGMVEETLKRERPVVKAEYEDPRRPNWGLSVSTDSMSPTELTAGLTSRGYHVKKVWVASPSELEADQRNAKRWPQDLVREQIRQALEEGAARVRFALPSSAKWLTVQRLKDRKWRTVARLSGSWGKNGLDYLDWQTGQHLWDGILAHLAQRCGTSPEALRPRQTLEMRHWVGGKTVRLKVRFNRKSIRVETSRAGAEGADDQ